MLSGRLITGRCLPLAELLAEYLEAFTGSYVSVMALTPLHDKLAQNSEDYCSVILLSYKLVIESQHCTAGWIQGCTSGHRLERQEPLMQMFFLLMAEPPNHCESTPQTQYVLVTILLL